MTKKFEAYEILDFIASISRFPSAELAETKFLRPLTKQIKIFNKATKKVSEEHEDNRNRFCSIYLEGEKKGNIIKDTDGERMYTPDNIEKLNKANREVGSKEIEVTLIITAEDIQHCPVQYREYIADFLEITIPDIIPTAVPATVDDKG